MTNTFKYEKIQEVNGGFHYRIAIIASDDRVATCYSEENAIFVTNLLNQTQFSKRNRERCESPNGFNHKLSDWNLSEWMTATLGELGEAANIIKKLNRHRDGVKEEISELELRDMLADELADTYIYLDLLFQAAGINKIQAIEKKFAQTSQKLGYTEVGE